MRKRTEMIFRSVKGFTLIEILVALALLVSTTALAAPNVMEALDGSQNKADAAQMDYLLASFQMHQAPFYDPHTNPYDMLNPAYQLEDGSIDAEQALDLYLKDVLDSSKDVYIEGVQCVTTEESLKDGEPVFQAESSGGMLWISCRMDGNRSNAETRIPTADHEDYIYSTGEGIRWGDSLLYIGDYENLESRFVAGQCLDYQMEAGFHFDNHVHQAGDHKSHMGVVFNYLDDDNFCLLDLELKNGTKKMSVYQVNNGTWTELAKNINIAQNYNLPGNKDYVNELTFRTRMTVWNSESGVSTVKLELAQAGVSGGNYSEVFTQSFSIAEEKKSSQYAFYIGEPDGNQIKQDGVIIAYKDFDDDPVDPDDPSTFVYEDVQIQLLAYPSFLCENEDGTFSNGGGAGNEEPEPISVTTVDFSDLGVTAHLSRSLTTDEEIEYQFFNKNNGNANGWDDSPIFGGNDGMTKVEIRILRNGSIVYGPQLFETEAVTSTYGTPSWTFNYNNVNQPITITSSDTQFDVEYKWNEGVSNSTEPAESTDADYSSSMHQYSPPSLGSSTGWLWARDYDQDGHGEWNGTPWVGRNMFDDGDLAGTMTGSGYQVSYSNSLPGMNIQYLGGSNGSWSTSPPILSSNADVIQARVMHDSTQVSYTISGSNFDVPGPPADPLLVEVKIRYQNKNFSYVTFTTTNDCVISYQTDKEGPKSAAKNVEIQLAKNSSWINVSVIYEGETESLNISNLSTNTYTIE